MASTLSFALLVTISAAPVPDQRSPPFVAGHDRFFDESEERQQLDGALLVSELSCTACHASDNERMQPKRGPRLDGVGLRLQSNWLRRYINDPNHVKPGTTMPNVIARGTEATVLQPLLAFLSSQRKPFPELVSTAGNPIAFEFWKKGNRERGRTLYHQVGCVACHEPDTDVDIGTNSRSDLENLLSQLEPDEIKELGLENAARPVRSVPHGNLATKYTRQSLTFFLLDPNETRPSGRMPSLKLKPEEAADIASYLLRDQREDAVVGTPSTDRDLIEAGRRWFVELRCANCHDIDGVNPTSFGKPLAKLDVANDRSCITDKHSGLPRYFLSVSQTLSLRLQVTSAKEPSRSELTSADELHLRVMQLNCYACHERNNRGGVGPKRRGYFETIGHVDLGDEGRLPPPLDGVGQKLTEAWFNQVLSGQGDIRPHMHARMPVFAKSQVAALPKLLAKVDATKATVNKDFGSRLELAESGRALLDLGCVQCHPLRGEYLPGVVGVDLAGIAVRVQPQWFRDFLLHPAGLKSRTRMPTFFPNGRSGVQSILDGDVDRQIAAMWTYLKSIERQPLPEKLAASKVHNFELVPEDRPVLLRTFMKQAGNHAIAVGFPQKVHVAFDAERVRIAQAWRGRFIDAHGTWFDRFTPLAAPLGDSVVAFPAGSAFALMPDAQAPWPKLDDPSSSYRFRGYRLDKQGVPTFLYEFDQFSIEDRVEPTSSKQLLRRIAIRSQEPTAKQVRIWFRANAGKNLAKTPDGSCRNATGLTVSVSNPEAEGNLMREYDEGQSEWLVPIDMIDRATIEVRYQW